jgi:hypothetical protein
VLRKSQTTCRLFGISESFGTRLVLKDLLQSLNSYQRSIIDEHLGRRMQEQSMSQQFSKTHSARLSGSRFVLGLSRSLVNAATMTRFFLNVSDSLNIWLTYCHRNDEGHSNLSLCFARFLFTLPATGFKQISPPLTPARNFDRLAPWLSQLQL